MRPTVNISLLGPLVLISFFLSWSIYLRKLYAEASIFSQLLSDTNLFAVGEKLIFVTYFRLKFDCQFEMASPRGYTVPQRAIPDRYSRERQEARAHTVTYAYAEV